MTPQHGARPPIRGLFAALGLVSTLAVDFAQAAPQASSPLLDSILTQAQKAREQGRPRDSIDRLKAARRRWPDEPRLISALALAYEADGNQVWALKVLSDAIDEQPPGCELRPWLAYLMWKQGRLVEAEGLLKEAGCEQAPPELKARLALLKALVAETAGDDTKAKIHVTEAAEADSIYAEDEALLQRLVRRHGPVRPPLVKVDLAVGAGVTSHAVETLPDDEPADAARRSGMAMANAGLSVDIPLERRVGALLGGRFESVELTSDRAVRFGHQSYALELGASFLWEGRRLEFVYNPEWLSVPNQSNEHGRSWYSRMHGFSYRMQTSRRWSAFGRFGYRTFAEAGRSRLESERGLGFALVQSPEFDLNTDGALHVFRAEQAKFDELGLSVALAARKTLVPRLDLLARVNTRFSSFPYSAGAFAPGVTDRKDARLGLGVELRYRILPDISLLGGPQWTRRLSNVDEYDRSEWRASLALVFQRGFDPRGPETIPVDHRTVGGFTSSHAEGDVERVKEQVQADQAEQRQSSCPR